MRAGISEEAVEDYAGHLEALPPVRVALVDGRAVVVGGLHRVRAHERAGRAEVPCTVEPMTWAEAVRAAVADNRAHGLRMTRADKRAAIGLLLAETGDLSSRDIAELVGCSHHTVEEVRSEVGNSPTCQPQEDEAARQDSSPSPAAPSSTRSGLPTRAKGGGKATARRPGRARAGGGGQPRPPPAGGRRRGSARPRAPARPASGRLAGAAHGLPPRRAVGGAVPHSALRSPDREYRAEALEELREALSAEELRKLAAWAEAAATAASDCQGPVARRERAGARGAAHRASDAPLDTSTTGLADTTDATALDGREMHARDPQRSRYPGDKVHPAECAPASRPARLDGGGSLDLADANGGQPTFVREGS